MASHGAPCEYGERRDSFDFEFRNKVDIEEVLNARIDTNSPSYLENSLIKGKEQLRDINTIPSIQVQSPTPEKVQLRPVHQSPSLPCPFNTLPDAVAVKRASLVPVESESTTCSTLDTRTPSRLTFNEKVEKFRRFSDFGSSEIHLNINKIEPEKNVNDNIPQHEGPRGMVTSTPAVPRTLAVEKVNFKENISAGCYMIFSPADLILRRK